MARQDTDCWDLEDVLPYFQDLEDPRSTINQRHPLLSVVVIALMAVLCGAAGPTAIARWANLKADWLLSVLPLPSGIPQKDVYRRLLSALNPETFQLAFTQWLTALRTRAAEATGITQPVLAVDGKTLRRSHDRANGLGALHSVSVWATEFGLSLGQVATEEKSNEITAIPQLLKLVDISGAIITIDAMGTQTAIAQQIVESGGDFVLALKGNQDTLFAGVKAEIDRQAETDFTDVPARRHITKETSHGREETRVVMQLPAPKTLPGFRRWSGLKTIGLVTRFCVQDGHETTEERYFISSLPMGVKRFAHAVRCHWGIENSCHWSLDVTYREDESRLREKHLRENFAWLRRFTLSLLKQHPAKLSLSMKRQSCGWSDDFLMQVLTTTNI